MFFDALTSTSMNYDVRNKWLCRCDLDLKILRISASSILETTITQSIFSVFFAHCPNYTTYGFVIRTLKSMCSSAPDFPHNLDKDISRCWLNSSICNTGIKILTLLIGLWFRLVIPALQTALKNHPAAKITGKQRCAYSAHPSQYHSFPFKSCIPCSHILDSLRWENGLMVEVIRHLFWNKAWIAR